jgi:chemotaxis protein methyltransferase CheR
MNATQFRRFGDIAYRAAGIRLRDGKESLVAARVSRRVRALALTSAESYLDLLEHDEGDELINFLDVISTNFTSFFRELPHFDLLDRALRAGARRGRTSFHIWSAASSSGEEPYSLAITAAEALGDAEFRILGTDISTQVLARARAATSPASAVAPIDRTRRGRWFRRQGAEDDPDARYTVRDELRERVTFARLNLAQPPFPMRGPFDVVFCRNVMIYFDDPVRQALIAEIERLLRPGGLLFTGHSETLTRIESDLILVSPSVYRKAGREP